MAARAQLIDREVLGRVGFTDHAIQRFAQRTGIEAAERRSVEPIVRDLLVQEGRVVARPPAWYRSSNDADRYLQAGEWLLFICRRSKLRAGSFDVVTVINNGERTTWERARQRGLIITPPPLVAPRAPRRKRVGWAGSIAAGLRLRRESEEPIGRLAAILRAHRDRRQVTGADLAAARAEYDARLRRHRDEREQAHARHVRMWGGGRR